MIVIHQSDNHGFFPDLPKEGDVVISSGDFFPNKTRGYPDVEVPFQKAWVNARIETFRDWLGGRPFIYTAGNHCYNDFFCETLKYHGIDATDITNKVHEFKGYKFYGFPWIPPTGSNWNYEADIPEMGRHIRRLKDILIENKIDFLICHCPPYGILDFHNENHWGNSQLLNLFAYGIEEKHFPKYLCCGHVHQAPGYTELLGIKISQAATKINVFDTEKDFPEMISL